MKVLPRHWPERHWPERRRSVKREVEHGPVTGGKRGLETISSAAFSTFEKMQLNMRTRFR
jgi:hypothetical protein